MSARLAGIVGLVALGCAGSPGGGGTSDATPGASPPPSASPTGPGSSVPSRPADAGFSRPLPDTTDRIAVFPDQLGPGLSDAQIRFVAERMVGSQKLPRSTSARIRAVNPAFVVLQYRLAYGLSTAANLIETDTWGPDTLPEAGPPDPRRPDEAHYLHHPADSTNRVRHADEYTLADVRNPAWHVAHTAEILRRMPLNDFDGIFLDTAHLRTDGFNPGDWHASFCAPEIPELYRCWGEPARGYFEHLVAKLHGEPRKYWALGNFGPMITGWDKNDYLEPLDGGVVELFMWVGGRVDERDWHIAAERIGRLLGHDKVFIAEPLHYPLGDAEARGWIFANFLLFKGARSFAAFYPEGTDFTGPPVWLPEYEVELGAPVTRAPGPIADLCTQGPSERSCAGVYVRAYAGGLAVVNPSTEARTYTLPEPPQGRPWVSLSFSGGGYVDAEGRPAASKIERTTVESTVSIPGGGGRVFIPSP